MIDWARISGFDLDSGNHRKSSEKHKVSQHEAEQLFFNQLLVVLENIQHSQDEARYHALGKTDVGHLLHIFFTLRSLNTKIRVISARDMPRKERTFYEQSQEDTEI